MPKLVQLIPLLSLMWGGCLAAEKARRTASPDPWKVAAVEHGKASWYGVRSNGGRHTASGERLENESSTAAHRTLPMNTRVRVTNLENGQSEIVRINNRGPYIRGRIIDVTKGVAQRIGFYKRGVVRVKVEVLTRDDDSEKGEDGSPGGAQGTPREASGKR